MEQQNENQNKTLLSEEVELKRLELFEKVINQIPGYLKYFDDKRSKHETPITKLTIKSFIWIVSIIIIFSGILVFYKFIDSSSFTFIIGTLIGYLFGISKIVLEKKEE